MKKLLLGGVIFGALLMIGGCFGPKTVGVTPKSFGVLNSFPDHPLYLKKQTLVARHKTAMIKDLAPKSQMTKAVIQYLEGKGYEAVEISEKSALADGRVDMMIEIVPGQVKKIEGLTAYGFSDRNFLLGLVKQPARSYVVLQLELSRKHSVRVVKTGQTERFSPLGREMLPDAWEDLTPDEKQGFEENLRENMDKAVNLSLSQLKI